MAFLRRALFSVALLAPLVAACSQAGEQGTDPADDEDHEEEVGRDEGALSSEVDCARETLPAYQGGRMIGNMDVIKIGGARATLKTGHAFLKLQKEANARGVDIWINSGFRTMPEQEHLYQCFRTRSCNNGNRAARPGYSNHQHGRALDIGTSNRTKLDRMIRELRLDWRQTVRGEAWHYEYFGPSVPGVCDETPPRDDTDTSADGGAAPAAQGCYSPTLGNRVADKVCVQGRSNGTWFQCNAGSWQSGGDARSGPFGDCVESHAR